MTQSQYGPRIAALARRAEREHSALVGDDGGRSAEPADAPAYLRDGAGQAIWLYVEARTGGRLAPFSPAELSALETAMNRWLECYARCYGVEFDADFSIRAAAELLVQTRNADDVGQLLTGVPERRSSQGRSQVTEY